MRLLTVWSKALASVAVAIIINAMGAMNPVMAEFPEKPITMVLGSTPGSAPDTLGRIVAERMANVLGQPVVVENKQGANGSIAATQVAQADPDGYTLMLMTAVHSITPTTRNDLKYDFEKDFRGVGMMASVPLLFVVNNDLGTLTCNPLSIERRWGIFFIPSLVSVESNILPLKNFPSVLVSR